MNGLHLIGDLAGCRCELRLLLDVEGFKSRCLDMVRRAGLTTMDATFHQFDGSGYTGTVVLAESHLAVHTWPERRGLTLDVYVCNYSDDNSDKARKLFDSLVAYFEPGEIARYEVERGGHLLMEPLNDSTGFYIKASRQLDEQQTCLQRMQVYDTLPYGKLLRLDGFNMTSEREEFVYHENLIHPALMTHPAPRKVLIVGGGDGGAVEEVLKHPSIEEVTLCEIDADVVRVAREHFQAVHHGALDDRRVTVQITDGAAFLRDVRERFDLVALDLNDPVGPAEHLYSEEAFRSCRRALSAGGALVLHLGSPWARPEQVRELARRLQRAFPLVRPYAVYIPLYGSLWTMAVCSDTLDPTALTPAELDRRILERGIGDLRYYSGEAHAGVFALPVFLRELVRDAC